MFIYFFLLDWAFYHEVMGVALARSLARRSFAPCQDLCRRLLAEHPGIPRDALVRAEGLPFDRAIWHGLLGECLVYGARAMPRVPTAPEALCCLLAPEQYGRWDMPRGAICEQVGCVFDRSLSSPVRRVGARRGAFRRAGLRALVRAGRRLGGFRRSRGRRACAG